MGVIKQGILGGFSGKVGAVVGSAWKGIAVMKSKPISVANPRTAAQIAQRSNMTTLVSISRSILTTIIKPLWDRFSSGMSGYNAFVSANINNFQEGDIVDESLFVISKGKMAPTAIAAVAASAATGEVVVSWVDDSGVGYKLASDNAFAVVMDGITGEVAASTISRYRDNLETVILPSFPMSVGQSIYVYLAFRRADGTVVSNTSYMATAVAA